MSRVSSLDLEVGKRLFTPTRPSVANSEVAAESRKQEHQRQGNRETLGIHPSRLKDLIGAFRSLRSLASELFVVLCTTTASACIPDHVRTLIMNKRMHLAPAVYSDAG